MPIRASIIYPYLAASGVTQISQNGHDVELLDCPTMELKWVDISWKLQDADLVILEGRTPIIEEIWKAISIIKGLSRGKIAIYGDHVSWDPLTALMKGADYVILGGDYDYTAAQLVQDLAENRAHYRQIKFQVVDLDSLPFVDRELVNFRDYYEAWSKRENFIWNMSQRGCFYRCIYCSWVDTFWNHQIRVRSPGRVADEYEILYDAYGELEILDDADLFQMKWGVKLAQQLLKRNFQNKEILWSVQTHPAQISYVSEEELALMKKSGLSVVKLGIESSHDISLWNMKKGSSRKLCEDAIRSLQAADVMVHANMMIGFPWETREMVKESVEWLADLEPNQAQFSLLIPYPNTEIWKMAQKDELFIQDPMKWENYDASFPMIRMDGLTGEEIVELYCESWSQFYFRWKYIWKHISGIRHWEGVKNLWRGFRSVKFGHMKAVDRKRRE